VCVAVAVVKVNIEDRIVGKVRSFVHLWGPCLLHYHGRTHTAYPLTLTHYALAPFSADTHTLEM